MQDDTREAESLQIAHPGQLRACCQVPVWCPLLKHIFNEPPGCQARGDWASTGDSWSEVGGRPCCLHSKVPISEHLPSTCLSAKPWACSMSHKSLWFLFSIYGLMGMNVLKVNKHFFFKGLNNRTNHAWAIWEGFLEEAAFILAPENVQAWFTGGTELCL